MFPENTQPQVTRALRLVNFKEDDVVEIRSRKSEGLPELPSPILVGTLFQKFLNLSENIDERFLKKIARCVSKGFFEDIYKKYYHLVKKRMFNI